MSEREAQYDVVIQLIESGSAVQLDATLYRNDERFEHIVVRGEIEVNELADRLVRAAHGPHRVRPRSTKHIA